MKPDKHKQKKQNEYKRKHGITNKPAKSDYKPAQLNSDKEKSINENKQNVATNLATATGSDPTLIEQESYNFQSANEENDIELEETEELETGEDLNEILKDTVNTLFQYQYHQDSFFEEIGDYKSFDDKCADVASIQPSVLSQILLGLPLYKRLDLEEHIFEPEDLTKMRAEAEKHLASTNLPQHPTQSSSEGLLSEEIFESSSLPPCDNTGVSRRKKTTTNNDVLKAEPPLNTMKTSTPNYNNYTKEEVTSEPQKVNSIASNPQPLTKQSTKHTPKASSVSKKSTMAELEDELDALLKL